MSPNNVLRFRRQAKSGIPRLHWEWVGGKTGYLWIGADEDVYLGSLTRSEAEQLRDFLTARLAGEGR